MAHKPRTRVNFYISLLCTKTKISEPLNIVITYLKLPSGVCIFLGKLVLWMYFLGSILLSVQDNVTGQDLDTIMYFTLLSTQKWSLSRSITYLVSMINPSIYCNTKSTHILSADRNQVVGNISKSSDQLKSNPSLYFSLRPLYHLSCSSFDFLGIVIVKVCFFPGADFLLNRALDSC